jgi:hypothetical protein
MSLDFSGLLIARAYDQRSLGVVRPGGVRPAVTEENHEAVIEDGFHRTHPFPVSHRRVERNDARAVQRCPPLIAKTRLPSSQIGINKKVCNSTIFHKRSGGGSPTWRRSYAYLSLQFTDAPAILNAEDLPGFAIQV